MISKKQLFLAHIAQTSEMPLSLEIERAEGMYIFDKNGKKYLDMNSGISVSSLGHGREEIVKSVQYQASQYMHTMVYGEHVQSPQVELATLLCSQLDQGLDSVYFVMTGSEAVEGAMKLAKRHTGRYEIVACRNAYHGSTQGAESLRSDENYKNAYYPLLPGIRHIDFNNFDDLDQITNKTAGVIIEPVQGEAGVISPQQDYLQAVKNKCNEVGALFILDEIQTGFGRTGCLFAHQKYGVTPDVLLIGKAMGGGMPLGGFVSSREIMSSLVRDPALGHITTFGGHPVSCAAGLASLKILLSESYIHDIEKKEQRFHQLLQHEILKELRSDGLLMAVELTKRKYLKHVVAKCHELGLLVDWFLFNNRSFRLAPPLIISEEQIEEACSIFIQAFDYARDKYL